MCRLNKAAAQVVVMFSHPQHLSHPILCIVLAAGFAGIVQLPGRAEAQAAIQTAPPADLTLAGETVLQLRATVGKLTPRQRMDVIEGRLARILAIPRLQPSDVTVFTPAGKPPVIYAAGRKLITVDAATADGATGETAMDLAVKWAKRFQQLLPLVDYRLPNDSEPVLPTDPPLTVTSDLTQVGGQVADVMIGKKSVIQLIGVQNGVTAAERADVVSDRLAVLLHRSNRDPEAVSVVDGPLTKVKVPIPALAQLPLDPFSMDAGPGPFVVMTGSDHIAKASVAGESVPVTKSVTLEGPTALVKIGDTPLITVTSPDALAGAQPDPRALAEQWAANIRDALTPVPAPGATPASFEKAGAGLGGDPEPLPEAPPDAPSGDISPQDQGPHPQDGRSDGNAEPFLVAPPPMDTIPKDNRLRLRSPLRTKIARRLAA